MQADTLVAYQIAFDLYDGATQHFLRRVQDCLQPLLPAEGGNDKPEGEGERWVGSPHTSRAEPTDTHCICRAEAMETDESGESQETSKEDIGSSTSPPPAEPETQSEPPTVKAELESEPEPEWVQRLRRVISVLGGECTVALRQDFLIRNNHTDLLILKIMKVWRMAVVTWPSCGHAPSLLVVTPLHRM